MGSGFRNFQNCHIWAWNVSEVAYVTLRSFYPRGQNWTYFYSPSSIFCDTGWFSNCHIWVWNLGIGQSSRSCTYTSFLPQRVKIDLIFILRAAASKMRDNIENCHVWAWNLAIWPKSQKLHIVPHGLKLSLYSLYGQRFSRYGLISKIDLFGHENCPLTKVPEGAHILSFYPKGSKLSSFFALKAVVSEIQANFQNAIFGHETCPLAKVHQKLHI